MADARVVETILELARWAPSGDNTQPWRFEIVGDHALVVHGFDTRDHCVYDLDGHPSQVSIGALLETISIAASVHGWRAVVVRRADAPETRPTFDVSFIADPTLRPDPLAQHVRARSVQRRAMSRRPLTAAEKSHLESAVGPDHRVFWIEGSEARLQTAKLMFANAKLRLTMPEAYRVHRDIIEWGARFSADRVPDQALGADPLTTKLMRWIMSSWQRVEFFNRYLAGTLAPRLQMDLLPGIACAAHFVLLAEKAPQSIDDYVAAGRAMQRFWLALTGLGLVMQPELTPLIFGRYVREGRSFSETAGLQEQAADLAARLGAMIGADRSERAVFMGRLGAGSAAVARSTRLSLEQLLVTERP